MNEEADRSASTKRRDSVSEAYLILDGEGRHMEKH